MEVLSLWVTAPSCGLQSTFRAAHEMLVDVLKGVGQQHSDGTSFLPIWTSHQLITQGSNIKGILVSFSWWEPEESQLTSSDRHFNV